MRRIILPIAMLLLLTGCRGEWRYPHPENLAFKETTLELTYMQYACDCAQWMPTDSIRRYDSLGIDEVPDALGIYLEPENADLMDPEWMGIAGNRVWVTGKFYAEEGYPLGYDSYQSPEAARVFRFATIKPIFPVRQFVHKEGAEGAEEVLLEDQAAFDRWIDSQSN